RRSESKAGAAAWGRSCSESGSAWKGAHQPYLPSRSTWEGVIRRAQALPCLAPASPDRERSHSAPCVGPQVGEHRIHAPIVGGRRREAELADDVTDVRLDRVCGDVEALGDATVGETLCHEGEHLALARCEVLERAVLGRAVEQLRDEGRVDHGLTGGDAPKGS